MNTKGLFGIMKGKAVVEINKKQNEKEATLSFVQGIIDMMELGAVAELKEEGDSTVITLSSSDSSSVIGYHGEVLDAIQTLAGACLNIGKKEYKKVVVDCENYRDKREDTLVKLAHKLEEKATEMRREVLLEPMSPYERRIIHTALSESQTVKTRSDGKEPNRYVVIVPNEKDEFAKPYNAGRNDKKRDGHGVFYGSICNVQRKGGRRNGGKKSGGFGEKKKSSTITFGTYLGNSLKDKE